MEDFVLGTVSTVGNIDFGIILRIFMFIYAFFWIMIVLWVWFDAAERSPNMLFRVFSVLIVLFFNIFGLLIYLLIRPSDSYEERYLGELEKRYLQSETGGLMNCPKCKFELEPGFVVCPSCGESLRVKCENCNMYIDKDWEFCAYCGVTREIEKKEKEVVVNSKEEIVKKPSKLDVFFCFVGGKMRKFFSKTKKSFPKSEERYFEAEVSKKAKKKKKIKRNKRK